MGSDDILSLRDYLTVLRRQAWLIVLTTVLVVSAAIAVSLLETPLYESSAEVVVEPIRRTQDVSIEQLLSPSNLVVQTERVIMTSRPVTERAIEQLGGGDPIELVEQVRVEVVRDTRVVEIIATDPDPVAAASIANAFANGYLDFRRDQAVDEVLAARDNLERRAETLREQIATIEQQTSGDEDEDAALNVQRDSLLAQLSQVIAQQSELADTIDGVSGGGAVIAPAEVSTIPVSPRPVRTGALALVLGLLLGVGFAFLRDHFDDVIRDEADFRRATGGRPILGRIPRWSHASAAERLATMVEPSSLAAESYRELSAGVRFLLVTHPGQHDAPDGDDRAPHGRSLMVVSASASEGKSSTAANLAVAAARVGLRTVLVDADLRRATIHKRFGFARSTGLSDLLLGDGVLEDHTLDVGVDNLRVLPAGTTPPNPAELLASPGMRTVQQHLIERADLVIYDTPAVLAVPDALELGRYVDLAVLVGRAGVTSRRQLTAAVERLSQVGTDIAGTVLNDIEGGNDGYYYSYYYADDRDEERRPWSPWRPWRRKPRSEPGGDDAAVPPGPSRERPAGVPPTVPTPLLGAPGARRSERRRDRGRSAVPEDAEQSPATEGVETHYSAVRPVPSPRDPAETEVDAAPLVERSPSRSRAGAPSDERPGDAGQDRTDEGEDDLFSQFRDSGR